MKDQEFEKILYQALRPEVAPEETVVHVRHSGKGTYRNMKQRIKKIGIVAATFLLLTTTVYAADGLNIRSLVGRVASQNYKTVEQAEKRAGFEIDAVDRFDNGFAASRIYVGETQALDEDDRVRLTYNEIHVDLQNHQGETLSLIAHEYHEGIESSALPPDEIRRIEETEVCYRVDNYKIVPADYERTEADKAWLQVPGNFMSYGAETVMETKVAFLAWQKDGICYLIMDSDGCEPANSLFSMAEELIRSGK